MTDSAQWFQSLGYCLGACGKRATGKLYNTVNAELGNYCDQCAQKRIAKAKAERARENVTLRDNIGRTT